MLHALTHGGLVNGLFFQWFWKLGQNIWKTTFSDEALKSAIAKIPWEFPAILLISRIPGGAWRIPWDFPDFPWKGNFPECVGTLANSGGRYSIFVSDVRGTVAPSPAIYGVTMRSRRSDLQVDAYGSFVLNNNIFTILYFNTCYRNRINRISIAVFSETFGQSIHYTPIRWR